MNFNNTCLMRGDMASIGGNYTLIRAQEGGNDRVVGLGSANQKVDGSTFQGTGIQNLFFGRKGKCICSVTGSLDSVRFNQSL